jgi:KDO2-lipid IV(A) lauroyltransferase
MSTASPSLRKRYETALEAVSTALFLAAVAPWLLLPADWTIRAFGAVGGWVLPRIASGRRVARNLARVRPGTPPAAVRALQQAVGDHFGRVLAEYIRLDSLVHRPERRHVDGLEHLKAAVAAGRGVVIASAHIGHWEMIRLAAADHGIPVAIIYRAFNNRSFDHVSQWRIRVGGEPVLHKGRPGMRAMLAHLKAGGVILVLMDQHSSGGAMLPFLGHRAATATAIPALCQRSGAALLPARALRQPDGVSFDVIFEAPLAVEDPLAMTAAMNARISAWIDETPGQWFWLHRRWRSAADQSAD